MKQLLRRMPDVVRRVQRMVAAMPWQVFAVLTIVGVWWLASLLFGRLMWIASVAAFAGATYWIIWPDAQLVLGRSDSRPWLVRLREHNWPRVAIPMFGSLPRAGAYVLLAIGWWWLLC